MIKKKQPIKQQVATLANQFAWVMFFESCKSLSQSPGVCWNPCAPTGPAHSQRNLVICSFCERGPAAETEWVICSLAAQRERWVEARKHCCCLFSPPSKFFAITYLEWVSEPLGQKWAFFCSAVTSQGLNYLTDYVWSCDAAALICSIEPTRKEIIRFSFSPTPTHSLLPVTPGLLYSSCAFRRLAYRVSAPAAWLFSVNLSLSSCHAVSLSGGSEGMFPYIMMRRRGGGTKKLPSVHFWVRCASAEMRQGHAGLASSRRKRWFRESGV